MEKLNERLKDQPPIRSESEMEREEKFKRLEKVKESHKFQENIQRQINRTERERRKINSEGNNIEVFSS